MSIDTALASTTSPVSVADTLSAWDALRIQLDAKRAVELAAHRQQQRTIPAPTAAELLDRLYQYNGWLDLLYVQNHGALFDWVKTQKAAVLRQLADLTAGATR